MSATNPGARDWRKSAKRRSLIVAVHTGRNALGWDDEQYRAALAQVTGKESSADCSNDELGRVIDLMRARGFARPGGAPGPARPTGDDPAAPQIAMIEQLWAMLAASGALRDPSETALRAFGKRLTRRAAPQFMTVAQRSKVIEALKAWCGREGITLAGRVDRREDVIESR